VTDVRHIVDLAFRLHDQGRITREELVRIVEQCINVVSIENGYAEKLGLPFPNVTEDEPEADRAP
jgi:hypothetical protein